MKFNWYWFFATAVYFYASYHVLWNFAGPDAGDGYGSGYTPGLILPGIRPPSVSIDKYLGSRSIRFQYRIPYLVVAFIFTLLGGIGPGYLLRRFPTIAWLRFFAAMIIGFLLLLVVPLSLDALAKFNIWRGTTWFTWDDWMVIFLIKVFLPLAILSGLIAVGARRFRVISA